MAYIGNHNRETDHHPLSGPDRDIKSANKEPHGSNTHNGRKSVNKVAFKIFLNPSASSSKDQRLIGHKGHGQADHIGQDANQRKGPTIFQHRIKTDTDGVAKQGVPAPDQKVTECLRSEETLQHQCRF